MYINTVCHSLYSIFAVYPRHKIVLYTVQLFYVWDLAELWIPLKGGKSHLSISAQLMHARGIFL